jgi:hypothetical protein
MLCLALALSAASMTLAQEKAPAAPPKAEAGAGHEPPAQAYADCKGKKAGDAIQHLTREGKVAATCEDSPKGLVARPKRPGGRPADPPAK